MVERKQINWDYAWLDFLNGIKFNSKEGDIVEVHWHPRNIELSLFQPGRFSWWYTSEKGQTMKGTLIEEKRLMQASKKERKYAVYLNV